MPSRDGQSGDESELASFLEVICVCVCVCVCVRVCVCQNESGEMANSTITPTLVEDKVLRQQFSSSLQCSMIDESLAQYCVHLDTSNSITSIINTW